jgi:hypothetical protein
LTLGASVLVVHLLCWFEQARQIAATSPEVLRWFEPAGVEIAESGLENSADYILTARTPGEPWWHEIPNDRPIPGPPMIVVSKATGAVRTSSARQSLTTSTATRSSRAERADDQLADD